MFNCIATIKHIPLCTIHYLLLVFTSLLTQVNLILSYENERSVLISIICALNPIASSNCILFRINSSLFWIILSRFYKPKPNQNNVSLSSLTALPCLLPISAEFQMILFFHFFIFYSLFNTFQFLFSPRHWNCPCQVTSVLPNPVNTYFLFCRFS